MIRNSLQWKITMSMWAVAALCILLAQSLSTFIYFKNQEKNIENELAGTASTLIALGISNYHGLERFQELDAFVDEKLMLEKVQKIIQIYTERGKMMFSSRMMGNEKFRAAFHTPNKPTFMNRNIEGVNYKVLTTPYIATSGKEYFLLTAMKLPVLKTIFISTLDEGLLLFIILSVVVFFVARYLASRMIEPVKDIAHHLTLLDPTTMKDWEPLIVPKAGDYLKDIVSGVNNLSRRVKTALYVVSRTNRYLAHELRNPLAIIMGEAETTLMRNDVSADEYKATLKSSLEEIERMSNVIETVSRLSLQQRNSYKPSPCELVNWIKSNKPAWDKVLNSPLDTHFEIEQAIVVIDQDLLYRLVDNLIRNIKSHSEHHTKANLRLRSIENKIELVIEDDGKGMPDDLIKTLNEGKTTSVNIGIGLSLCLEIASICGFKLSFENKTTGGLKTTIVLE